MDKKRKAYSTALAVLCALTAIFIWSNSLFSREGSQGQSRAVMEALEPVIEFVTGQDVDPEDDHFVRKLAHFLEFGLLGAELTLLAYLRKRLSLQSLCNCLSVGLAVAVTDEALQLLSDRGSQVQDVLLDLCGVCTALALTAAILAASAKRRD